MNIVLIIPTGIGAEIGGHAGDGNPVAKLFASLVDNLITHPNVVNASDINEMTDNTLYVEGSILDRFLWGDIELKKVNYNKILCVANKPIMNSLINSVSAARATIGADIDLLELEVPLIMIGKIENNKAGGTILGWLELIEQVKKYEFDALAISSEIEVDRDTKLNYYRNGGINPWGGIEAITSKLIADKLDKPVAHAPYEYTTPDDKELYFFEEVVDPRIAAECVSVCYIHCVFKGLHKAPRIGKGLSVNDVDFMISPYGCFGEPHKACMENNIPIIIVEENTTCLKDIVPTSNNIIMVKNYHEAAGIISSIKAGIKPSSVRRPLKQTVII